MLQIFKHVDIITIDEMSMMASTMLLQENKYVYILLRKLNCIVKFVIFQWPHVGP